MTNKLFFFCVAIFFATIILTVLLDFRSIPKVVQTNLENIPIKIGEYRAFDAFFSNTVYEELNADKYIYRHYLNGSGKKINLYIGYYGTAKGGRTGHNPFACLPGAGWGLVDTRKITLMSRYYPKGVEVNCILACKGELYMTMLHWYQTAGTKVLVTGVQQNIQRFLGRALHNRNDGAFVQVSTISGQEHTAKARELVKSFAQEVLRLLPNYWPKEE